MDNLPAFWVVIPAAGIGSRMRADRPKQYLQVAGRTILEHSLSGFLDHPHLRGLVLALAADDPWWPTLACAADARIQRVRGGAERADSVLAGLDYLAGIGAPAEGWVLVHDAARPNLARSDLDKLLHSLADDPVGGLLAVPARDTLKRAGGRASLRNGRSQCHLAGLHTADVPPGSITQGIGRSTGGGGGDYR